MSTLLAITECKLKAQYILLKIAKTKKVTTTNSGEDAEKLKYLYIVGRECKMLESQENTVWQFLKNIT